MNDETEDKQVDKKVEAIKNVKSLLSAPSRLYAISAVKKLLGISLLDAKRIYDDYSCESSIVKDLEKALEEQKEETDYVNDLLDKVSARLSEEEDVNTRQGELLDSYRCVLPDALSVVARGGPPA